MASILFSTVQDANQRSREWWIAILGRAKRDEDVTEYLYGVTVDGASGDVAISVLARDVHLDALLRADQMTADEVAALVSLYTAWSGSSVGYAVGDIRSYGSTLFRCVQAHTSQADWHPDAVPALWTPCAPAGVIPEWVQPAGAHDAYALDAQVTHNGHVWQSLINANVWEPGAPGTQTLWQLVE